MHEPLVEALPGLVGAASAVGGLGGMLAVASANFRKRRQSQRDLDSTPPEEASKKLS
jgi:hypothetical protein